MSGDPAESALNPPQAEVRARLHRLAYAILSPSLGRRHRTLIAHMAVDRALSSGDAVPGAPYSTLRERVVRRALATGRRRAVLATRATGRSRSAVAEADPSWLEPAARRACALRHLEGLDRQETHAVLSSAGVGDPATATTLADRIASDVRP